MTVIVMQQCFNKGYIRIRIGIWNGGFSKIFLRGKGKIGILYFTWQDIGQCSRKRHT